MNFSVYNLVVIIGGSLKIDVVVFVLEKYAYYFKNCLVLEKYMLGDIRIIFEMFKV